GVKDMTRLPGAIFVVDARREAIAVREAHRLGIPIIAITDTNADPDLITYPIPGNDDAIRSVSLISGAIAEAISQARKEVPEDERRRVEDLEATTYSTETGEKAAAVEEHPRRRARRRPRPGVIAERQTGSGRGDSQKRVRRARVLVRKPGREAAQSDSGGEPAKPSTSQEAEPEPSRVRRAPPKPVASRTS
ncbi:MAG: 30S ribosomal protein S2, partial [Gammaproteobacteria bacterium]|nr:30S ribosomal protein S2 [Gammaproteobacteria bacterium]